MKLKDPDLFPIVVQGNDPAWKLSVSYDFMKSMFTLAIDDVSFLDLIYSSTIIHQGPQNIEVGSIYLNDKVISEGFAQWTENFYQEQREWA